MSKKKRMETITELPRWKRGTHKGKINWKETIGMIIEVEHVDYGNINFKVVDYINKYLILDYNGYVLQSGIQTGDFLNGQLGGVMNITNSSRNTYHLDDNNILHIYGENKDGKWEALYSGKHIKEVMNSTWLVSKNKIITSSYNFNGKPKSLHHLDIKTNPGFVVDHMANPYSLIDKFYDNRVENLSEVTCAENSKNKKCRNEWGYTGLRRNEYGWYSAFKYNGIPICIKTKRDLNEAILDNLISQKYLGYKHQVEEFWRLDELPENRIKEVADWLDEKINNTDTKIYEIKEYEYDIEQKDGYYILKKNGHEMLFDCDLDYIKDKNIYPYIESCKIYFNIVYLENNKKIQSRFHRDILGFKPNDYKEYNINIDHLNRNSRDNRLENLVIASHYSNSCNKSGVGYHKTKFSSYLVEYMRNYKFWYLIGGVKTPTFKTEQEAIQEVERRKSIIENARVKLKNKQELDELIQYCVDNNYLQENGLADLDLGYLYFREILKEEIKI